MPPLGLSAGVRKAREIGLRTKSLLLARPRMVSPAGQYAARAHDGVLVLQRGENASTDYYLRPRLERASVPVRFMDIESAPGDCELLRPGACQSLLAIVCRYASAAWLDALEAASGRLARAVYFMDDDLPAMIRDSSLPTAARGKVARHFAEHVQRLDALVSEVWTSTAVLAARYPEARATVLDPLPEAEPPEPSPSPPRRVVYHSTDVHGRERRFVLEIARRLAEAAPDVTFELTGDAAVRRAAAGLPDVEVTPQLAWPAYLARQQGRRASISLAPLFPSEVNGARAPVKAFDAARLGAAGLYADTSPYQGFVRDGIDGRLLPMEADAWARAIQDLLADEARRLAIAQAARERLVALRREGLSLPLPGE